MGYRSEVALVMSKEDYLYGLKWMNSFKVDEDDNLLHPKNVTTIIERDDNVILHYESVKWYSHVESFRDLSILYNFLDTIGPHNYGIVRIGEEWDDLESEADINKLFSADVYPVTSIDLNHYKSDIQITEDNFKEYLENEDIGYFKIVYNDGKRLVA